MSDEEENVDGSEEQTANAGTDKDPTGVENEEGKETSQETIVEGKGDEEEDSEPVPSEPVDDWREKAAEHYAAGDKKLYKKELARLQRVKDSNSLWGMYRELESKFTSGTLIKKPGKDASEEDVKAYHKAIGVPDDPEEYLADYDPPAGSVMEESDSEVIGDMIGVLHSNGASKEAVHSVLNWYFDKQAEQLDSALENDERYRHDSISTLKEELGPSYKRTINSLGLLFSTAYGGNDLTNEKSVAARVLGGRTSDGKLLGDDPDVIRWLISMNSEINPLTSVVDGHGDASGKVADRIAEIEKYMREDRKGYSKDEQIQAEYRRLVTARQRAEARS